jgi:hypothetical protein
MASDRHPAVTWCCFVRREASATADDLHDALAAELVAEAQGRLAVALAVIVLPLFAVAFSTTFPRARCEVESAEAWQS